MSDDNFRQVTVSGYGSRLKQSFASALGGLLLFLAAFPLEFWNEGRAVAEYEALREGAGVVRSIAAQPLDPGNAGELVHVSGAAHALAPAVDPDLGISVQALVLVRKVEMFQWREVKDTSQEKQLGGGTRTVIDYHYEIEWGDKQIDSAQFQHPEGHQNPDKMPFSSARFTAPQVKLGDFALGGDILDQLSATAPLTPKLTDLPPNLQASFQLHDAALITSKVPDKPLLGDVRVTYGSVPEQAVSVIAAQNGSALAPYTTRAGRSLLLVEPGELVAAQMFKAAEHRNAVLTWVLRGVGFLMMWIGLAAAVGWIGVSLDFIPIFGSLVQTGIGIVAALIAAVFSLLTIAVAWLLYRPLLAIALIAAAAACAWALHRRRAAAPPPAPRIKPPPG